MKFVLAMGLVIGLLAPATARAEDVVQSSQSFEAAWSIWNRKYRDAQENLIRVFPSSKAKLTPTPARKGGQYVIPVPPAVKNAGDVDAPARGHGVDLLNYLKKPDVKKWYSQSYGLN